MICQGYFPYILGHECDSLSVVAIVVTVINYMS